MNYQSMEGLIVSNKEQGRLRVLNEVMASRLSVRQAASLMGVRERQGWRLRAGYRAEGIAAVVHGNRGRKPAHTLPPG